MDMEDAERIKLLIVDPMVQALRAEITPLLSRVEKLEEGAANFAPRIQKLESYAGRLVKVYSGVVALLTFGAHAAWQKLKDKYHLS